MLLSVFLFPICHPSVVYIGLICVVGPQLIINFIIDSFSD